MIDIIGPSRVIAAFLHHPITWPDGRVLYAVYTEGGGDYGSLTCPIIRDAANQPLTLSQDIAPGSVVRLAVTDDLQQAVPVRAAGYPEHSRIAGMTTGML
jgi:hypothetical protein